MYSQPGRIQNASLLSVFNHSQVFHKERQLGRKKKERK